MNTKICGKCKIEKDLTMFSKEKNGKIPWACKECKNKMYKEWEAKNPEKRKKLHRKWSEKSFPGFFIPLLQSSWHFWLSWLLECAQR